MLVHGDVTGADHAGLAHAHGDDGGVRRPPAPRGHDALRGIHASHVLRRGLGTDEDDLLARVRPLHRAVGIEDGLADGGPGGGRETAGQ